jgi:hypothetical protein
MEGTGMVGDGMAQTMHIHVSKCKNDKIKEEGEKSNLDISCPKLLK